MKSFNFVINAIIPQILGHYFGAGFVLGSHATFRVIAPFEPFEHVTTGVPGFVHDSKHPDAIHHESI